MRHGGSWRGGLVAAAPLAPGLVSVGVLYGVTATDAGMPAWSVVTTSLLVATGTAQFLAVELLGQGHSWWAVVAAGVLVNLRYAAYSLHLGRFVQGLRRLPRLAYLAVVSDEGYALTTPMIDGHEPGGSRQLRWSAGVMLVVWAAWQVGTVLGVTAGRVVPDRLGLETAIPLTLVTVLVLLTSSRRHAVVAIVAGATALVLRHAPFGLGLIAGMTAGVMVGLALQATVGKHRRVEPETCC
ncbi:MAG: AzlC family ABC transporter permease [Thermoanaerobaculia bacterium]|nr:AzlC family ABC transporter permease [Thermoanaerobaculia bacterium]